MIYMVRHGQTAGNKAKILQGRGSNHPLNEAGEEQAKALRRWFEDRNIRIDRVYASPLLRAVQTARIIAGDMQIVTDDHLLEMDYGPYEGMDLASPAPEVLTFFSDFAHNPAPQGMEPLEEVVKRMGEFLEAVKPEAEGRNILIATHAIAMKGALEYLTPGAAGAFWGKYIPNCALYAFSYQDGACTIPEEIETAASGVSRETK